jgi:hypothetical protein
MCQTLCNSQSSRIKWHWPFLSFVIFQFFSILLLPFVHCSFRLLRLEIEDETDLVIILGNSIIFQRRPRNRIMSSSLQRRKGASICRDPDVSFSSPGGKDGDGFSHAFNGNPFIISSAQRRRRRRTRSSYTIIRKAVPRLILAVFLLVGSCFVASKFLVPSGFLFSHSNLLNPNTVRLPVAHVDISVPNATEWPLIHIVNTRFMQEQGPLTTLGMARLHLFQTFCFPTMTAQSTQEFLWIIKTDPLFATPKNPVFVQLLEMVQPFSNIYIVASNRNFLISPDLHGCWRDGAEGRDLMQSQIFSGNQTRLLQAIALREERPVLETRLDADDGLHKVYLQYMQYVAMKRFTTTASKGEEKEDDDNSSSYVSPSSSAANTTSTATRTKTTKWLYWCTRRHLEWRPAPDNSNDKEQGGEDFVASFGVLNPVEHSKLCITPGITVGYNVGVRAEDVPSESHDLLYKHLANSTACYSNDDDDDDDSKDFHDNDKPACLDLVDNLLFSAVRARTLTSAGMQNVASPSGGGAIPSKVQVNTLNHKLWQLLEDRFHMNRTIAQDTARYLQQHKAQIAYENLLGQCTSFHSCKQQAKDELQKYIEKSQLEGSGGTGSDRIQVIYDSDPYDASTSSEKKGGGLRAPWRPLPAVSKASDPNK